MTIRINSTSGVNRTPMGSARRAIGDFSLSPSQNMTSASPAKATGLAGLMGMDALLALQGEEDVLTGRRRRQIQRSNSILDILDEVKVAMLSGEAGDRDLLKLRHLIAEQRENVEDNGLQDVLDQIEVRAAVELAKRKLM